MQRCVCVCVRARTRTCLSLCVYADGRTKSGARASAQSASVHLPAHKLNCRDTRRRLVACQHGTAKHQILTPTFSLSRPPPHAPPRLALVLHASPLSLPVLISSRLLSRTGSVATLTSALRTRSICDAPAQKYSGSGAVEQAPTSQNWFSSHTPQI